MDEDFLLGNLYADEEIPDELFKLVQDGLVGQLEIRLNELSNRKEYLHAVRWYGREQMSLLMVAASCGHESIVELLLHFDCSSEHVELVGKIYIGEEDKRLDGATALYCAFYNRKFAVAKILIEIGRADVTADTTTHSNLPLLLHATFHNRLDIVRFLVDNRYADVNTKSSNSNAKGWSTLFHAAHQNHTSIIEYLISNGADLNYVCERRFAGNITALSLTIEQNHFDSFLLLCRNGANLTLKNDVEKTFFKSSLKVKSYPMIKYFLDENFIEINDVECAAAAAMSKADGQEEEIGHVIELLRLSLQYRRHFDLRKEYFPSLSIYNYQCECETIEELDALLTDRQRLLIETILIAERNFSSRKDSTLHSLVEEFGTQLVQQENYEQCLDLWLHLIELDQQNGGDYGMHLFVWYFCKLLTIQYPIAASRFLQTAYLIFKPAEMTYGEKDVNNALFLIVLALKIVQQSTITADERISIFQWIQNVCQLKSLVTEGKTLLHLCVDRRTSSNLTYRGAVTTPHISFPNAQTLYLLLSYGRHWLDVNSMDSRRNTPLHVHCQSSADPKIIEILLHFGAHLDCVNRDGKIATDFIRQKPTILSLLEPKVIPSNLKCLCARRILQLNLTDKTPLEMFSSSLKEFLHFHGDFK